MKYPRIEHVIGSHLTDPDDLRTNLNIYGSMRWIITEKVDGAQMGIQFIKVVIDVRNRNTELLKGNMDRQFHPLPKWIKKHYQQLVDLLGDRYILFGEWMFHVHTVHYNNLPDLFIAFGLYDKENECFVPFLEGRKMIEDAGFKLVPIITSRKLKDKKDLMSLITESSFGEEEMEGVVLHSVDDSIKVKFVTERFKQAIDERGEHWRRGERFRNKLSCQ